ncbi:UbiX family flavin prenyltransferase [Nitratidesulfovibrio sp. HK-II]|uniref:UbiX family flavin prenyltransferase n=1 Tax=Nitratidesulfovibrio sp. HK-II TaxID=2009266 RepID=UPI000E2F0286|nr:UbiX family flavin prenyltransferase [Nitratidesulfovibrio sp. HK-II]GBO97399.1 3-polyprenyl-4-hydroxybenzoate carboxy-lyase UbiX [Nitratidesulfovibrio sp. HK-II]
MKRFVVGISGASGMPLAVTLLRGLRAAARTLPGQPDLAGQSALSGGVQTHLVVSDAARQVLALESDLRAEDLLALADVVHDARDFGAPPSSGSWPHDGMVVCPCSMSTLAAIAHGTGSNLLHRAADVTLKERRPLVLVVRETPLSRVHLRNMLAAAEAGAVIMPPCPGFYARPASVQDILDHLAGRILDQIGVPNALAARWGEAAERE